MIPIRLHLSGFLSYLDPVDLDFDAFDLACISGQNGAGKSSLLDAITWVLFGEARRRDDSIINHKAEAAEVALVFDYENNRYRIQRSKPRGKTALLEFAIQTEEGSWKVLTEATLRATEERIRKTLRLDYETFINASFFLQGKADQFAQQKPADRKRILSSILGLEIWESYKEEASRRRLAAEKQLAIIADRLQEIEEELNQENDRKVRLAEVEKEFTQQNTLFDARKQVLDQQRLLQEKLKNDQRQVEKQVVEVHRLQNELEQQNELLKSRQQERAGLKDQLGHENEIKDALATWKKTQKELEKWDALAANFQKFEGQRHQPLQIIAREQARLETELKNLRLTEANILQLEAALPALKQQAETFAFGVKQLAEKVATRTVLESDLRALADERGRAKAENEKLANDGKELNERIERLNDVKTSACPVCGKPLSPEERTKMIADLQIEVEDKRISYRDNQKSMVDCNTRYADLEAQIDTLQKLDNDLKVQQRTLDTHMNELSNAEKVLAEWQTNGKVQLQTLDQIIAQNEYAFEARQQLASTDAELKGLGYDAAAHEAVKKAEFAGRASQDAWVALEKAKAALSPLEREIEALHLTITQKEDHLHELADELNEAQVKLSQEQASLPDITELEREYYDLQEAVNRLRDGVAQARNEVIVLAKLREKKELQKEEKEAITHQVAQLKTLERAFGKDGIPALLIEQALPEIESHANEILDRLSDGNMSVKFETQREFKDKKRDDRKETLDILIRDSMGERDYELFSGGEAFRINFAIRLALSRVLAHRAGARLQTLVIDEGFGSQDTEGRQRLIEAINLVRCDFSKVLVITHMEELKDAFPARIEVQKTDRGSRVEVITS